MWVGKLSIFRWSMCDLFNVTYSSKALLNTKTRIKKGSSLRLLQQTLGTNTPLLYQFNTFIILNICQWELYIGTISELLIVLEMFSIGALMNFIGM